MQYMKLCLVAYVLREKIVLPLFRQNDDGSTVMKRISNIIALRLSALFPKPYAELTTV